MANADLTPGLDIGNSAKVYLDWADDARRWVVSPVTMDGAPLDTDHDAEPDLDRSQWTAADREAIDRADAAHMPTGIELIGMLFAAQPIRHARASALVKAARRAADGDSNDGEIEALQEAMEYLADTLEINPDFEDDEDDEGGEPPVEYTVFGRWINDEPVAELATVGRVEDNRPDDLTGEKQPWATFTVAYNSDQAKEQAVEEMRNS